jgi:hypothetical protein
MDAQEFAYMVKGLLAMRGDLSDKELVDWITETVERDGETIFKED